jgi:hypothetical protein
MTHQPDSPPTAEDYAAERSSLRHPNDGLQEGFSRPALEPLASRLERAVRVNRCGEQTFQMLAELNANWPCTVSPDVWVRGILVPYLVVSWKGVFLIWPVDQRWTVYQAAMVMPARVQIQAELSAEGWSGQVEAVFHSPREETGWQRNVLADEQTGEPIDIVLMYGRIDELLAYWKPPCEFGIDPEWIGWLSDASKPRWWKSDEGRSRSLPPPPAAEQL